MLTTDISSVARHRDETLLARSNPRARNAKFSGEIYRAACTGKCRGPVARFVAKIFATAFSMFSSRVAYVCVYVYARYRRVMRPSTLVEWTRMYAQICVHMCLIPWRWRASLTVGFISIVFPTNKR